jgi:hypothetical protein
MDERTGNGACLGSLLGMAAGLTGAVWGGYELGSAINDAIGVQSTVGRGALDFLVMSTLAAPAIGLGSYVGLMVGGIAGALTSPRDEYRF